MSALQNETPGLVPVLAAGRHRSPRKGACFMEFASYLAGERWSDHPACTHPALAFLARMVNDFTTSGDRSRLAVLIPSVIGVTGSDPRMDFHIALRAATMALPIASEERQRALAVGILATQAQLEVLGHPARGELAMRIDDAFAKAPFAERWAREFVAENQVAAGHRAIARMTESIIRTGVLGIAQACSPGANECLRELLRGAIDDCTEISAENRFAGAGALQLEEAIEGRGRNDTVPQR